MFLFVTGKNGDLSQKFWRWGLCFAPCLPAFTIFSLTVNCALFSFFLFFFPMGLYLIRVRSICVSYLSHIAQRILDRSHSASKLAKVLLLKVPVPLCSLSLPCWGQLFNVSNKTKNDWVELLIMILFSFFFISRNLLVPLGVTKCTGCMQEKTPSWRAGYYSFVWPTKFIGTQFLAESICLILRTLHQIWSSLSSSLIIPFLIRGSGAVFVPLTLMMWKGQKLGATKFLFVLMIN